MTLTSDYYNAAKPDSIAYTIKMLWTLQNNDKELKVKLIAPGYAFTTVYDGQ